MSFSKPQLQTKSGWVGRWFALGAKSPMQSPTAKVATLAVLAMGLEKIVHKRRWRGVVSIASTICTVGIAVYEG